VGWSSDGSAARGPANGGAVQRPANRIERLYSDGSNGRQWPLGCQGRYRFDSCLNSELAYVALVGSLVAHHDAGQSPNRRARAPAPKDH